MLNFNVLVALSGFRNGSCKCEPMKTTGSSFRVRKIHHTWYRQCSPCCYGAFRNRKPSFLKNLRFLFILPLLVVDHLCSHCSVPANWLGTCPPLVLNSELDPGLHTQAIRPLLPRALCVSLTLIWLVGLPFSTLVPPWPLCGLLCHLFLTGGTWPFSVTCQPVVSPPPEPAQVLSSLERPSCIWI